MMTDWIMDNWVMNWHFWLVMAVVGVGTSIDSLEYAIKELARATRKAAR